MAVPAPHEPDRDVRIRPDQATAADSVDWDEARQIAFLYARRLCDYNLAEDVAQESIIKLRSSHSRIKVGWRPYLRGIVYRVACTVLRDSGRMPTRTSHGTESVTPADDPSADLVAAEDKAALKTALTELDGALGRGTRAIIELRIQNVKWVEVADIVQLAKRTCQLRYDAGIEWLRNRLSNQDQHTLRHAIRTQDRNQVG